MDDLVAVGCPSLLASRLLGHLVASGLRVKELPVAVSEHAFFVASSSLATGFDLLKAHANYPRTT